MRLVLPLLWDQLYLTPEFLLGVNATGGREQVVEEDKDIPFNVESQI